MTKVTNAANKSLGKEEYLRYARHISLPEIGEAGQVQLKSAKVLIVGAGGLGAPLTLYLAAAGVGTIGLVDFDVVDRSNLQRQILYGESDIGQLKTLSAQHRIADLNPNVRLIPHNLPLQAENALKIIREYDIVADGTDNFATRYLINDACVMLRKPNVYASIFRFEGQVSIFDARISACYRCVYPNPPPPAQIPNCAEAGVIGALPGIIGSIQAMEVIKWITGTGDTLTGKLLLFDALSMRFESLKLRKNEKCPVCGKNPSITTLSETELNCGEDNMFFRRNTDDEISVRELHEKMEAGEDFVLLDVREPAEVEICTLKNSILIPLNTLPNNLGKLDTEAEILVFCRSGARSKSAQNFLKKSGFKNVKNVTGGVLAWSREIDPTMPTY
ncbi:MAG: molybdopterin-synthase adenylyltransferase MoeB [Calditrichaeota bacterium]|nr:molybdopterin-synthase adenylyltransferase MoeB [Calditrichota bacterium]